MPPTINLETNNNVVTTKANGENELSFPYEIKKVDHEINKQLLQDFKGELTGFVQVGPKKYFFPNKYEQDAKNIYNFKVRPDDVWVVTFPRSGTTWTQEMVWLIANDLDYKTAMEIPLLLRFPFFEYSIFVHKDIKEKLLAENSDSMENTNIVQNMDEKMWEKLENVQGRRFIKTHLPYSLLPPDLLTCGAKVIYVARNPKDVAVSFYHLNRLMRTQGYQNDWPTYFNYFKNGLQPWCPYFEHLKEGWQMKNEKNHLFLFYEDMNKNLRGALNQVAAFLGKSLNENQLHILENHLHIKNFRQNSSVNFDLLNKVGVLVRGEEAFIRQGKSGSWKDNFDEDLNTQADKWIKDSLKGTDIKFPEIN